MHTFELTAFEAVPMELEGSVPPAATTSLPAPADRTNPRMSPDARGFPISCC